MAEGTVVTGAAVPTVTVTAVVEEGVVTAAVRLADGVVDTVLSVVNAVEASDPTVCAVVYVAVVDTDTPDAAVEAADGCSAGRLP